MWDVILTIIILALTTAITCGVRLYPSIIKKARKISKDGAINQSPSFRAAVHVAGFLFAFVCFPAMMLILFNDENNAKFNDQLVVSLSKV